MKLDELKTGTMLSYLQMGLSMIIELCYTPIMIRLLGRTEYGLYNTAASIISTLAILNLGFNSGYIKYYAKYKEKKEYDRIHKLNGVFLSIFIVLGIIALVCGLYLTTNIKIIFKSGLTFQEYKIAKILMFLLTINLSLSFPMSVFENIIFAHEKYIFLKLVNIFRIICGPLIMLPLLFIGYKSIMLVSVSMLVSLSCYGTNIYYFFYMLHEKIEFSYFDRKLLKDLFIFSSFIALNIIVDQINNNVDNILLARIKGVQSVAVYAVAGRLYTAYSRFSTAISGIFTPRIHKIMNKAKSVEELTEDYTQLFVKIGRIQFLILGLIASGLVFFGKRFIVLWAGLEYLEAYYVILLLAIPAIIPLIQNIGIEIQRAENKHQFRSIIYLVMAILNLGISYILCFKYGVIGVTMGTSLSLLVANGIIMNIFYHKCCHINILFFWKNIVTLLKGSIVPMMLGIFLVNFINQNNIFNYIFSIFIYILVYCLCQWKFGMNFYEKSIVKKCYTMVISKL